MDALPGPTLTMNDDSPPPFGCDNQTDGSVLRVMEPPQFFAADGLSGSSSSIGTPDESGEDDEGGEETQSKLNRGIGLDSWDSLEESLRTKKGLSGHFDGKSRSFTDLSQVRSVKELQKQENPFNKRRRLLMASRLSRRSAFYSWSNPKSMPLLPLHEEEEEEEEKCRKLAASPSSLSSSSSSSLTEEKKQEDQILLRRRQKTAPPESTRLRPAGSFRLRSFSLADLKEHDDDDEEEDA